MGITVNQSPSGYASANSELWHVVESTNKNVAGFQYVFDIYKGATLITRVKNSPYGTDKLGVLDVHNIVRAQFSDVKIPDIPPFDWDGDVYYNTDIFFTDYDVRYGEVSGGVTTTNIASGTHRVYNNYERQPFDTKSSEITGEMILSNRPATSYWYAGHPVFISMYLSSAYSFDRRELVNGSPVNTYTNLENTTAHTVAYIPSSDVTTFEFRRLSPNTVIDTLTLKKKCSKYTPHTLVFMNAFGAWDSFTFVHGKRLVDNQKKRFEQFKWNLSSGSMVEKNARVYNESSKVYAVDYGMKMQLTSDILSTGEYDWLIELINSPIVYYLDVATEDYYPVIVTDSNYEYKDDAINKTDTLIVNIEFSDRNNTQYR